MSGKEMTVLAGELMFEHADLKKIIAARLAEAKKFALAYAAVEDYLSSNALSPRELRHGASPDCLADLPDAEIVKAACEDAIRAMRRKAEIAESLRGMGLEVRE